MFDYVVRFVEQARVGFGVSALTAQVVAGSVATEDLGSVLEGVERARRAADAAQLAVLAELARRTAGPGGLGESRLPAGEVEAFCGDEAALLLGCSATVADRRCRLAARLVSDLEGLVPVLVKGEVSERVVQLVATETQDASPEGVAAVVEHVLAAKRGSEEPRLVALEPRELARSCRRVLARADAAALARRAERNRRDLTDVHVDPGPVGTSVVSAVLPSEVGLVVQAAVEELARQRIAEAKDDPTRERLRVGAARAQALTDLVLRGVSVHARVAVTVPVETFAPTGGGETPPGVEAPGVGWLPPEVVARVRAGESHEITRVLLDAETGQALPEPSVSVSQVGYVPRSGLRAHVVVRDGTCRMFGCTRPAERCDLDHATPWPQGPTSPENLAALCRRHHRLKQDPRWGYRLDPDGIAMWTSPSGTSRVTWPQTHLPTEPDPTEPAPVTSSPPPAGARTARGVEAPPF